MMKRPSVWAWFLLVALFVAGSTSALAAEKWVRIVKHSFELSLMDGEQVVKTWPIAWGRVEGDKQKVGDMRTPEGAFTIQEFNNSKSWTHDFGDGKGQIAGAYGPWFIRLKTPGWQGIGIHGTHDPDSIGTKASEGCIRMRNQDLVELKAQAKKGMKVVIEP